MEWINPREKLPQHEQIIWILRIENREGERQGLPSARIDIAQAQLDRMGVMSAEIIIHKGYPQYRRHFYEWWHFPQNDRKDNEPYYRTFNDDDLITAWMPYESNELPSWEHIGLEESKKIILANEKYQLEAALDNAQKDNVHFIHLSDHKPDCDGVYVVANEGGIWLSRYEIKTCNPWKAPNGKSVIAWYPIPSGY